MKKKFLSILFIVSVMLFTLCGCSSSADATYGGYTATELEQMSRATLESITALSDDEIMQYIAYYSQDPSGAIYTDFMSSWLELKDQIGTFNQYDSFKVDKTGKTVSATLVSDYSKRDIKFTVVFKARNMEVTAMDLEPVYSLSEIMQTAALNTFMGISVVFVILILISLIISCFKLINKAQSAPAKVQETKTEVTSAPVAEEDDTELVAVIAAAIAASTGASTDSFVVRSIKRRF